MMDLTGIWTGETIGATTQTHHWIIVQHGMLLDIYTRWQDENTFNNGRSFEAIVGNTLLQIKYVPDDVAHGVILGENALKMLNWVYGIQDGTVKPLFDVLFERTKLQLQQFEVEFLLSLYNDKTLIKRLSDLPYA